MANARNFSLLRNIQTSSGAYTVSYSICMGGFPKRKVARGKVDHFPPTRAKVKIGSCYNSIPPACLHGTDKKSFIYFTFTLLTPCTHQHNTANDVYSEYMWFKSRLTFISFLLSFFLPGSPKGKCLNYSPLRFSPFNYPRKHCQHITWEDNITCKLKNNPPGWSLLSLWTAPAMTLTEIIVKLCHIL